MDSPFFALVAICIFLLLLTFYLAVRRRRRFSRQQEQREQSVPFDYSSDIIITVPSSSQAVSRPYRPRSTYPSTSQRQQAPYPSTSAAYKPETSGLDAPPPSYQDYARDVQLVPRS